MLSAVTTLLTTSCSSSDNTYTPDDYLGVTAATFGALRRQSTTSSSYSTYTPSSATYPIYIDQLKGQIYNPDSLPVRTIPSKILLSLTFKGNAYGVLEALEKADSFSQYYYASDTLDFSKLRKLRVISSDGGHSKDYTIDIRIHKTGMDSIRWNNMGVCNNIKNKKLVGLKAVGANDALYLLATDTTKDALNDIYYSMQVLKTTDGNTWSTEYSTPSTKMTVPFSDFKKPTIGTYNNKIYLLHDGMLRCSDNWSAGTACTLRAILGGYGNEFYGVSDQKKIQVATSDPMTATFSDDEMEDMTYYAPGDSLPYSDYNLITTNLLTDPAIGRAVLLANKQYDAKAITAPDIDKAVIWSKIVDSEMPQKWFFMNPSWENHYKVLPRMEYLSAAAYADGIIAIGGNPSTKTLYYSNDWGTTWTTKDTIKVPEELQGAAQVAIVADDTYIYLIDGNSGEIWRGIKK